MHERIIFLMRKIFFEKLYWVSVIQKQPQKVEQMGKEGLWMKFTLTGVWNYGLKDVDCLQ